MAFTLLKKADNLDYDYAVIANSVIIGIGDCVNPGPTTQAPFLVPAQNSTNTNQYTGAIMGVCTGIFTNGKPAEVTSITAGASNQTTGVYLAEFVTTSVDLKWVADASADLGTTTGSDTYLSMFYVGYNATGHHNTAFHDAGQIDESSTAVFTTQLHFFSYGAYKSGNVNATTGKYTQLVGKFSPAKQV